MSFRRKILAVAGAGVVLFSASAAFAADYTREIWSPLHSAPAMAAATDNQCLACHSEILSDKPLEQSHSNIRADSVTAWYQTLATYDGKQETFHRRHLVTPLAKQVMDLKCSTCHTGHDPREELSTPKTPVAGQALSSNLRKQVNVEATCLMCHGKFPYQNMDQTEDWPETRKALEVADKPGDPIPNGCLTCHGELFRTVRHQVNFLKPEGIEALAKDNTDVCYGCHGGRAWYRISYPYPRHKWPGMPETAPEWAAGRPTESDPRFLTGMTATPEKKK